MPPPSQARSWIYRYAPAGAVLVLGFAISAWAGLRFHRRAVEADRARLQRIGESMRDGLKLRIQTSDLYLRHGEDYFSSQEDISELMFREWCMKYGWSVNTPWLHGVAFYTNKNTDAWRKLMPADPAKWTPAELDRLEKLAAKTPIDLEFGYGYCSDGAKRWPTNYAGRARFDWAAPIAGEAPCQEIRWALSANSPGSTTRRAVIEKDGNPQYGATVAVPIYSADHATFCELVLGKRKPGEVPKNIFYLNWLLCRGVLLAPIDYVKLEGQIQVSGPQEVGIEIFASEKPEAEQWLNPTGNAPRALDPTFKPYLRTNVRLPLYNRVWTVFVYTLRAFEDGSPRYLAQVTFGAGSALTLLAALLVGIALRARDRQEFMTAEITDARDALAAAEREREKLGHDLHDGAIQSLYAVQLGLGRTADKLATEPGPAKSDLAVARNELDAVIAEIRRFILSKEGNGEKQVELAGVLSAMVQRASGDNGAKVRLQCEPAVSERLSPSQAVQVANVAREAFSNALRHGKAAHVEIKLRSEREGVCLEVCDDGAGFDVQAHAAGIGIKSMNARTSDLRGKLEITSWVGKGTRVVLKVPALDHREVEVAHRKQRIQP